MVGAIVVGRISVKVLNGRNFANGSHTITPEVAVKRGDEIGIFHLGSTVVLLLEPGIRAPAPLKVRCDMAYR